VSAFLLVVQRDGITVPESVGARYATRLGAPLASSSDWHTGDGFLAYASARGSARPTTFARVGDTVAVGTVRIDNRAEVRSWVQDGNPAGTDLELVLQAIRARGIECIPRLLGDFAFIAWTHATRRLIAARDTFGVIRFYQTQNADEIAFSSHAAVLANERGWDKTFCADVLINGFPVGNRTIYPNVSLFDPASILERRGEHVSLRRYWRSADFPVDYSRGGPDQVDGFRALFEEAVAATAGPAGETWALLSGGVDSSSIVSMLRTLVARGRVAGDGVAGTLTFTDALGDGNESMYVDAVLRAYPVKNEQIADMWWWQDDGEAPPITDAPERGYPSFALSRVAIRRIRSHGGRVLLTGLGSDNYLSAHPYHFADMLWRRQFGEATRRMVRWAALRRQSAWTLAYENAIVPLFPRHLQSRRGDVKQDLPSWMPSSFVRQFHVAALASARLQRRGRPGHKYGDALVFEMDHMHQAVSRGILEEAFDIRHPFLYRPLVEYGLQLAPDLRTTPLETKAVLQRAMRGILPEEVRTRRGKGGIDGRLQWAMIRERPRIERLLQNSELADLGCIDPRALLRAVDTVCRTRAGGNRGTVINALALETWLAVRSGRWAEYTPAYSSAASPVRLTNTHAVARR
jgi:asparagine synthase (glutamine-hydrolysing)